MTVETVRRPRRRTLTDKQIAALPRKPKPYFHPDPELPKHGVRVRPVGPASYTVIVRDAYGKQRWVKIGGTAEMKIEDARERARTVISRVRQGLEPVEPPPTKPDTVAAVAANWLHRHVEKNKLRTGGELRRIIERYILPHIGDRDFVGLRRTDIARLLDHIEDQHGARTADTVLATLRSIATWVAHRDDDYVAPFVRGMKRVPAKAGKRSRTLTDDELRRVWRAAGDAGAYGAVVKLLLLTAQRREKVLTMQWSDISDGVWTIRTEHGEKGNAGALKLPDAALDIIRAQPRFAGNPFVFAGRGFNSRMKHALDRASGVSGWVLHDLRRCARSLMSRAGVRPDIAERVLGHAIGGVEGVYDQHPYHDEKADALRKLAALVERIVNPPEGNVVTMRPEAAAS
jgi:integrase